MGWSYQQKPPMGWPLDLDSGLADFVGVWFMQEGSGTKVFDLSGNGRDATATGAISEISWQSGPRGHVVDFVGDTQASFQLASAITFTATDKWTIAWRAIKDGADTEGIILGKNGTTDNYIHMDEGTKLRFRNSVPANANFAYSSFTSWGDYALVAKGDGNAHLYVNGVFNETLAVVSSFVFDSIGNAYNHDSVTFDGRIEYVYIYNRPLIASEIAQLYQEPFCMFKDPDEIPVLDQFYSVGNAGIMTPNTGYWGPTY